MGKVDEWVPHPRHPKAVPPGDKVVLSAVEQLEIFDEFSSRAFEMALDSMAANFTRIRDLARQRLESGFDLYRDEMFGWDNERLHAEAIEEYADAVNYWSVLLWKQSPRSRGGRRDEAGVV